MTPISLTLACLGVLTSLILLWMFLDRLILAVQAKSMIIDVLSDPKIAKELASLVDAYHWEACEWEPAASTALLDLSNFVQARVQGLPKVERQIIERTIREQEARNTHYYLWDIVRRALKKHSQRILRQNASAVSGLEPD